MKIHSVIFQDAAEWKFELTELIQDCIQTCMYSPFILSIRNAKIYDMNTTLVGVTKYQNIVSFFKTHEGELWE